jgi:hypothetical protein
MDLRMRAHVTLDAERPQNTFANWAFRDPASRDVDLYDCSGHDGLSGVCLRSLTVAAHPGRARQGL